MVGGLRSIIYISSIVFPCVEVSVGSYVGEENTHSMMLASDVPVHVRYLFGLHNAIRTLESRSLTATITYVPPEIGLPREATRAIRTAKPFRFVSRVHVPAIWNIKNPVHR